jgi:predicted CXXCH cytochrome family protein
MLTGKYKSILVLVLVGSFLAIGVSGAFAQEYAGSSKCKMCHGMMNKPIVEGWTKSAHAKAFRDATKDASAILGVFDASAPIKKEQVKYTLGSCSLTGQAYIGPDMKTLPAEWDSIKKSWTTTTSADATTQCISCHVTGYDAAKSTWAEESVACEDCHGPGGAHVAAGGAKAKIVNPKNLSPDKEAMVCGRCHSKGTDPSKKYAFPIGYKVGEDLSQSFVDAQPKTSGRNQQYSELRQSKHFTNNVFCVKCHDPHGSAEQYQLRKPIIELCLDCHKDRDMKTHAPGAAAGATCATCHMPNGSHAFVKLPA